MATREEEDKEEWQQVQSDTINSVVEKKRQS